jgi:hypothetical protein
VAATPSGPRPPQNAIRGGRVPPSATPLLFFFKKKKLINFFKKIKFYFLVYLFFLLLRWTWCRHLISTDIALTWRLTESVKNFNRI